jgi:superfamily II DNA/RNA helicase
MQRLRRFDLRVAVASDVLARGIDLPAVNVVIHLNVSHDAATYMHRIGRAGRFGTKGVSISLLFPEELQRVQAFLSDLHGGALFLCFNYFGTACFFVQDRACVLRRDRGY